MTGECGRYGKCLHGSIAALETMETIQRVSWWNTWQNNPTGRVETADAMLVDASGTLLPPGRALAGGLLPNVDCSLK